MPQATTLYLFHDMLRHFITNGFLNNCYLIDINSDVENSSVLHVIWIALETGDDEALKRLLDAFVKKEIKQAINQSMVQSEFNQAKVSMCCLT